MSLVTSVILTMNSVEDGFDEEYSDASRLHEVNDWLGKRGFGPLKNMAEHSGGSKHPQTNTFYCGYNYFPAQDFLDLLKGFTWIYPENVILLMEPEDGRTVVWRADEEKKNHDAN